MSRKDWTTDGYPHERDSDGTCRNCGASNGEYHYRLVARKPKPAPMWETMDEK